MVVYYIVVCDYETDKTDMPTTATPSKMDVKSLCDDVRDLFRECTRSVIPIME